MTSVFYMLPIVKIAIFVICNNAVRTNVPHRAISR